MGKLKKEDIIEIRKGIKEGKTYQELADQFQVSRNCIWGIKHNKTHKDVGPDVSRKHVSRILSNRKKTAICISIEMGESRESIAKRFKVSPSTISRIKKESAENNYGVDVSKISRKKLTAKDAEEIRKRLKEGEKGVDLAREYGVTKTHISDIKNYKCWISSNSENPKNEVNDPENRYQIWEQFRKKRKIS